MGLTSFRRTFASPPMQHWPKGTQVLRWIGEPDWEQWMVRHGIPAGRYDRLADLDL